MNTLHVLFTFPTVVFSVLMIIVLFYWVTVIIGALDIDIIHIGGEADGALDGAVDGALDGAVDGALDGAVDGALDGAADGALDGAVDGALDGAADGALDGVGHGALEGGGHGADGAADAGHPGGLAGLLSALGLRTVPVTISFSLLFFYGWCLSFLSIWYLNASLGRLLPALVFKLLVLLVAFIVATFLASLTCRPLGRVFVIHQAPSRSTLIGRICTVTTSKVNNKFGQAEVDDGGAGLLLQVRCDKPERLKKGSQALIVTYDKEREAFVVEPYDEMM